VNTSEAAKPAPAAAGHRLQADRLGGAINCTNGRAGISKQAAKTGRRLEILALRGLELADRVAEGSIKFIDAVDVAYDAALWSGLVDLVGDDIVQATLAAAFANARRAP
jgi:hypothetical protein